MSLALQVQHSCCSGGSTDTSFLPGGGYPGTSKPKFAQAVRLCRQCQDGCTSRPGRAQRNISSGVRVVRSMVAVVLPMRNSRMREWP